MHRGFTIVELLITLVVLTILLTIGVAALGQVQANARDTERQTDAEAIARGLEGYYRTGNPKASATPGNVTPGTYPGFTVIAHMQGANMCATSLAPAVDPCNTTGAAYTLQALPGVTREALKGPRAADLGFTSADDMNAGQKTTALASGAYLYEPFTASGDPCQGHASSDPCVRFTLRYQKEVGGEVIELESKHT